MKHFFFHVRRGGVLFLDHEGKDLTGLSSAWAWAIRDAQSLLDEGALDGDVTDYSIEIADEAGRRLATVPVSRLAEQGLIER